MQTLSFSQRLMETYTTEVPTCAETKEVNLFTLDNNCNHDANVMDRHGKSNFCRTDDNIFNNNAADCYEQQEQSELQEDESEEPYSMSVMPSRSQMHLRKEQEVQLTPRRATNHSLRSASAFRTSNKEHKQHHKQLLFDNLSTEEDASFFLSSPHEEELEQEHPKKDFSESLEKSDVEKHTLFACETWPHLQDALPQLLQMYDVYKHNKQIVNKGKRLSSRVRYHSERYGNFIGAYLKWSADEVRKACLKARNVSAVGIVRANKNKSALLTSSSFTSTNSNISNNGNKMNTSKGNKTNVSTRNTSCAYKTSRPFRRHTALAVEGDALFAELIEYAHDCDEQKHNMAEYIYANKCKTWKEQKDNVIKQETVKDVIGYSDIEEYELWQSELNKLTPNARCIAIHYGINQPSSSSSASSEELRSLSLNYEFLENYVHLSSSQYHRASLMAIIATTRLEKNTVIVVDISSYYRCLNEERWYRYVYGTSWHNRYNNLSSNTNSSKLHSIYHDTTHTDHTNQETNSVFDDVYSGVKVFARWPESVPFYHGVGEMHSTSQLNSTNMVKVNKKTSSITTHHNNIKIKHNAIASFPFTLVDLVNTPELGPNQMGLAAAMFIPYATCFLYTGPVMSTQQTEQLLNHKVVNAEAVIICNKLEQCKKECVCENSNETNGCIWENKCTIDHGKHADVLDDTYALGLDNDNICFGQGLSRYINHRYNMNRFGNCELCTILLSLPASVVKSKQECATQKATESKNRKCRVKQPSRCYKRERDEEETEVNTRLFNCTNKENVAPTHEQKFHNEEEQQQEHIFTDDNNNTTNNNNLTRIPCNSACMLTIPFFLTTTDIHVGHSLLAWTYGEDYDAKLERIAVAGNQIVPFCDSIVLNNRATYKHQNDYPPNNNISNGKSTSTIDNISKINNVEMKSQTQRYGGDYRFALSTGDIVWRRRPRCTSVVAVKHFHHTYEQEKELVQEPFEHVHKQGQYSGLKYNSLKIEMHFDPEKYYDSLGISFAHPQYDLFQVMGVMKNGMEYLLLREIAPYYWNNSNICNNDGNKKSYDGEWVNFAKEHDLECIAANHITNDRYGNEQCCSCGQVDSERQVHTNVNEWAFYRLHQTGNYKLTTELNKCVVANSDSVGLLLSGMDYHIVNTTYKGNVWSGLACAPNFVIYLHHLVHATSLVNSALATCTQLEPEPSSLWSGSVWPLLEKCTSPQTIDEMLFIYCSSSEESDYWSDDSYSDDSDDEASRISIAIKNEQRENESNQPS